MFRPLGQPPSLPPLEYRSTICTLSYRGLLLEMGVFCKKKKFNVKYRGIIEPRAKGSEIPSLGYGLGSIAKSAHFSTGLGTKKKKVLARPCQ